ncbi:MAG: 30S ribosomal protein S2 [bacterium]|nr:30S ribosomal protein S2 [bacterium]
MNKDENKTKEAVMTEMARVGLHLGRQKSKGHPKMKPYICAVKNGFQIIDLEKTVQAMEAALAFMSETAKRGGTILFTGVMPAVQNIIEEAAKSLEMPYVTQRWIGGTLTNFKIIQNRLNYYKDLVKKRDAGELQKYTKKEQLEFGKKIVKLEQKFGGIFNLNQLPSLIFVVNPKHDDTAVREARRNKIPIVALVNTDTDPGLIDWPIPANNNAVSAVKYIMDKVVETITKAKSENKTLS